MKNLLKINLVFAAFIFFPEFSVASDLQDSIQNKLEEKANDFLEDKSNKIFGKQAPSLKIHYLHNDAEADSDGWSLDYQWHKDKTKNISPDVDISGINDGDRKRFMFSELAASFDVDGTMVRQGVKNSNNLSTAAVSLKYNVVDSGWLVKLSQKSQQEAQACVENLDTTLSKKEHDAYLQNCYNQFQDMVGDNREHTYAYDLKIDYKIEANDDYTEYHKVYGLSTGLVFTPHEGSRLQALNIFDYPFRYITRPLLSGDSNYNASLPSVYIALEQVDPSKDSVRNALADGKSNYDRWKGEVSFLSQIANIKSHPIMFESAYLYYREISPATSIKAADLDKFEYATATIYIPAALFKLPENTDFYISYTHGKLPFDVDTNEVITLGWKSNLKDLGKLLLD